MDGSKYTKLMEKLDMFLTPVPFPAEASCGDSAGFITESTKVSEMNNSEILKTHTLLHLFYNNHSGKNLTPSVIKKLHNDCVLNMVMHNHFDKLDG